MTATSRLPTFLVIGAMKCGTTSLYHYLAAHPQIFMSNLKEVDFFVEELSWRRGLEWYGRHFVPTRPEHIAVGEASTSYTKHPRYRGVPSRIAQVLGSPRLVYVVRNPVDRIRSHYEHNVALGQERDSLPVALQRNSTYLDYSRYAMQVAQYMKLFPRDHLLVITAEDLRTKRAETLARVIRFVGADPTVPIPGLTKEYYRTEERPAYGSAVAATRRILRRFFPRRVALWRGTFLSPSVKRMLSRGKTPQQSGRVVVPEETQMWIRERLRSDVEQLRAYLPDSFDGWDIA